MQRHCAIVSLEEPHKIKVGVPIKKKRPIPFEFVIEALEPLNPYTKPMFGCTAIYSDFKILFILRNKDNYVHDNGVWIATTPDHHKSLKREFPNLRSLELFGSKHPTAWQNLPADAPDFEESVMRACELALAKDPRIGKIPGKKKKTIA